MQAIRQLPEESFDTQPDPVLGKIGHCLRQGCVICIEHTPVVSPRYTPWQVWGKPSCYNGNPDIIYGEIDRCRDAHSDHHIRLNVEDYSCRSRFSFVVHRADGETG